MAASRGLAIFTICSNAALAGARVLLETAALHHPGAALYLCLADTPLAAEHPAGCTVIAAAGLGIPRFEELAFACGTAELQAALKPFMFRRLLSAGHDPVLYFAPDVAIFSRLESVLDAFAAGAALVLTPYLRHPAEADDLPEAISRTRPGALNPGFMGVAAGPHAEAILREWSRRVLYSPQDEAAEEGFEQDFIDRLQGFGKPARVLRDAGLNAGYWNLHRRPLSGDPHRWTIGASPLGFFQFAGFDPGFPGRLSHFTQAFRDAAMPAPLRLLCGTYASMLLACGHARTCCIPGAYERFVSGTPIPPVVRRMFRQQHRIGPGGDPFQTYEAYLHLPSAGEAWRGSAAWIVTNLMSSLRDNDPALTARFDIATPQGVMAYVDWMLGCETGRLGDPRLLEPLATRIGNHTPPNRLPPAGNGAAEVSVIGYLRSALGVGEAARLTLRSLAAAGVRSEGVAISVNSPATRNDSRCDHLLSQQGSGRFLIFNVNPDHLQAVRDHLGDALRDDAYRICVPFWELSGFPGPWIEDLRQVDEIWAPTRFIQSAIVRKHPGKPVVLMPLGLDFEPPFAMPRARFGLPADRFLFFFAFDYLSIIERKNPLAAVAAFKRAFRGRPGGERRVSLVIKTLNAEIVPERGAALRDALRGDPDVTLMERTLDHADTLGLIGACDAVISLHRSEGLGLLVAEAMALGKPVVATDYSATTELVTPHTGYPVNFALIPVRAGDYSFHDGQVWADPDICHAAWQMRRVVEDETMRTSRVRAAKALLRRDYSAEAAGRHQVARLRRLGRL